MVLVAPTTSALSTGTLIAALLLPSLASAQPYPQQPAPAAVPATGPAAGPAAARAEREGMLAGIGLGFGTLAFGDGSDTTSNYHLHFGGFLNSQWAMVIQLWGGNHSEGNFERSNSNFGIGLQHWISSSFWIRGAVGSAKLEASNDDVLLSRLEGAVVTGGIGWDAYSYKDYQFNLSVDLGVQGYEDVRDNATSIALQVGVQYY